MIERLTPRRLAVAAGLVGLLLAWGAPVASADDGPSALERLSEEERAHLAKEVPGWDELDPARKERIAKNLLRVRQLPPEERERLARRIEQLKRHREARMGPPRGRHHDFRDPKRREELKRRGQLMRAVGIALWENVSPETKAAVRKAVGSRDARWVEMAFFRRFWEVLARKKADAGEVEIQISDQTPDRFRRQIETWQKEARAGDAKARMRLAHVAVRHDFHELTRSLGAAGAVDEAALRRIGALFRERHGEAFDTARAELETLAADPEALRRYIREGHGPRGRGGHRRSPPGAGASLKERARYLREAIDQASPLFQRHSHLRAPALRLRRALDRILSSSEGEGRRRAPGWRPRGPRRGPPPPPEGPRDGEK